MAREKNSTAHNVENCNICHVNSGVDNEKTSEDGCKVSSHKRNIKDVINVHIDNKDEEKDRLDSMINVEKVVNVACVLENADRD